MPDFKLLGNSDPPTSILGKMTQGLGFPLRDVDDSASGGAVTVQSTEVLRAFSTVTQQPSATDTALQVSFGAPQSVPAFDLDALGNLTCNIADEYSIWLRVQFGRTGNPGSAIVLLRALLNGVQAGTTVFTELDDGEDKIPGTFQGILSLVPGDVITVETMRDSAGVNAGGLFAFTPTAGWIVSPSAQIIINRFEAVTS